MIKKLFYSLEDLRLRLHFRKMLKILLKTNLKDLSQKEKENRKKAINSLKEYAKIGKFPRNTKYSKSFPHIRDVYGTSCAMGYVIEHNEGKNLIDEYEKEKNLVYFKELEDNRLNKWLNKYGMTKQEAIAVQPTYPPYAPGLGTFSLILWLIFFSLIATGYGYVAYKNINKNDSFSKKFGIIIKAFGKFFIFLLVFFIIWLFFFSFR